MKHVLTPALLVLLSIPSFADADPKASVRDTVRLLYAEYAGGDVEGLKRLLTEGVGASRLRDSLSALRVKCIVVDGIEVGEAQLSGERADVTAKVMMTRRDLHGGPDLVEVEHAIIGMKAENGAWRIDKWTTDEELLVDKLLAAKSPEDALALLRENPEMHDYALSRALRARANVSINRRKFDEVARLTSMLKWLGAFAAEDTSLSAAYSFQSMIQRIGPAPDLDAAVRSAEEGVAVGDPTGQPDVISSALINLARAYQWREHGTMKAVPLFERIVQLRDRLADEAIVARAAMEIANSYDGRGDYRASFPYLQLAREIAERRKDNLTSYGVEVTLGDIYLAENDLDLAVAHIRSAADYAKKARFDIGYAAALQSLALAYRKLGRIDEFRTTAAEALEVARTTKSHELSSGVLVDIGLDHLERGDLARAESSLAEALRHAEQGVEPERIAVAEEALGRLRLAQHRYRDAIETTERAIAARSAEESATRFDAWLIAARAHLALNEREASYAALKEALRFGELEHQSVAGSERQIELAFEPLVAAYEMLVDLLVEDHRDSEAFLMSERAKARTLLELLASERARAADQIPEREMAEERRLEARLASLNRAAKGSPAGLTEARLDLESYRSLLEARYPRLGATRGAGELRSIAALEPLLRSDDFVLVEYTMSEDRLQIFIVRRGSLITRTIHVSRAAIEQLADDFGRSVAQRDLHYRAPARKLYDLVLKPALAAAGRAHVIGIVPDGALWRVPFEALVDSRGKFAVERAAFFYAPSAAALLHVARPPALRTERDHRLLAFANPTVEQTPATREVASLYRDMSLGPISEAESEVKSVRALVGARQSTLYMRGEASESRAKKESPGYRIIHFATHGIIDDQNPMYSHLVMARTADASGDDGLLEAREMANLRLEAELVVLSACDTARGGLHAGEGLIGMTWALFAAGCRSVIASQWRVDSAATEKVIVQFYRQWLRENAGQPLAKAKALQRAHLAVLRQPEYRHPYYWSPFVLLGSGN